MLNRLSAPERPVPKRPVMELIILFSANFSFDNIIIFSTNFRFDNRNIKMDDF